MWDNILEEKITSLLKENNLQKHKIEQIESARVQEMDNLIKELITVVDVFEKSEKIIQERELDKTEEAQKAINRILLAKKKLLSVLENNAVKKIELSNNMLDDDLCIVAETMPDANHPNNLVLEIIKNGYYREERVLRRAEVVIVKN
jgi:molecular chaperone GrpE (heat shock protein)